MSIDGWIKQRCDDKRLYAVEPSFAGDPHERSLWVSPEIWVLINGPWKSVEEERRCSRLRADLEAFVMGHELSVCLRPYEAEDAYLGYLESPTKSVWDIRSRDPKPGIRLLGSFLARDKFVALIPAARSTKLPYIARGPLDAGHSKEWKDAINDCEILFRSLFDPLVALKGDQIYEILGEKFRIE